MRNFTNDKNAQNSPLPLHAHVKKLTRSDLVQRTAITEYGVPKEMLTDNGRQYTNWRGTSRFEAELKKESVRHIKSRPQHPMTLGKVERFWRTIWDEYLGRAQFDSFESAQARLALWVKHYNHRRPHSSLDGMCPADRFFGVESELRLLIEKSIQQNILELALRGEPQKPFYMVGRMDGQSVVMRAEKGKLVMQINDDKEQPRQELIYDLKKPKSAGGRGQGIGGGREVGRQCLRQVFGRSNA